MQRPQKIRRDIKELRSRLFQEMKTQSITCLDIPSSKLFLDIFAKKIRHLILKATLPEQVNDIIVLMDYLYNRDPKFLKRLTTTILCSLNNISDQILTIVDRYNPRFSVICNDSLEDVSLFVKYLADHGCVIELIIKVSGKKVNQLKQLAEEALKITRHGLVVFTPIPPIDSLGNLIPQENLPEPEDFAEAMVDLYRSEMPIDCFPQIDSLRQVFGKPSVWVKREVCWRHGTCSWNKICLGQIFPHLYKYANETNGLRSKRCNSCTYKHLCTGNCPLYEETLHNISNPHEESAKYYNYAQNVFCTYRKALIKAMIADIGTIAQLESHSSL